MSGSNIPDSDSQTVRLTKVHCPKCKKYFVPDVPHDFIGEVKCPHCGNQQTVYATAQCISNQGGIISGTPGKLHCTVKFCPLEKQCGAKINVNRALDYFGNGKPFNLNN